MKYEDLKEKEEEYQRRMDEETPENVNLGTVILPSENLDEEFYEVYDELMTEHGFFGIQYMQESLHSLGKDWMNIVGGSREEIMEDFERFKESA
jgi:hypothetical protein